MNFEHSDIVHALQAKFKFDLSQWPQVGELTRRSAQQIRLKEPGVHWGYFPHPQGREDVVGVEAGGRKYGWDIVVSAGGPSAYLNSNPETLNLDGHEFRVVEAKDWLTPAPPTPDPPTPDPPHDDPLVAMVINLSVRLDALGRHLGAWK